MINICILLYPQHPPLKTYSTGPIQAHTAHGSHIFVRYAPKRYRYICTLPPERCFRVVRSYWLCGMRRRLHTSRVGYKLTWRYAAAYTGKASEPIRVTPRESGRHSVQAAMAQQHAVDDARSSRRSTPAGPPHAATIVAKSSTVTCLTCMQSTARQPFHVLGKFSHGPAAQILSEGFRSPIAS